jgi:hypothetical protein
MRLRPLLRPVLRPLLRLPTEDSRGFWPGMLFASGEQGFLFINDISTMYQDSAGTTPAVLEQPVGKWLDQSGRGNHATQPTSANRPTLKQDAKGNYYVHFNGTNQWMQTGSVDFTATDKMTVFAGVTKLSDAALGTLLEHGVGGTDLRAFTINAPRTAGASDYGADLRDGVNPGTGTRVTNFASPNSSVLAVSGDYGGATAGQQLSIRVNGALPAQTVIGGLPSGKFGNYPAYIGARGSATPLLFLSGDIYCLSARGALTTDSLIAQAERWINGRMGGVF